MRECKQIASSESNGNRVLDFTSRASSTQSRNDASLSNDPMSNEALIAGIISRNPIAARQFHRRYSSQISRWVWRTMGADTEHEDLVQQVLIQVLTSIHSLKQPDALDSWIKCITVRVVRDELRKRKNKRFHLRKAVDMELDSSKDPGNPLKYAHIRSFYTILDKLSPNDRIVFVLKHLEGYTNDQIAEYCGFSISTAKRRLERARARFLKDAMQDYMLMSLAGSGHDAE